MATRKTHILILSLLSTILTFIGALPSPSLSPSPSPSNNFSGPVYISNELGINCRGSFWCPWLNTASNQINLYLQAWLDSSLPDGDIYAPGAHIACAKLFYNAEAAYCVFTRGPNVSLPGINGSMVKTKMGQLKNHGCFACGSVPLKDNNRPGEMGELVVDYVAKGTCSPTPGMVVCEPSVPSGNGTGGAIKSSILPIPMPGMFSATKLRFISSIVV